MEKLSELTNSYGPPDILIDSCSLKSNRYAAWGFEEIFEVNHKGCFLNNQSLKGDIFSLFQDFIDKSKNKKSNISCIGFISYEFKNFIYPHISFNKKKKSEVPFLWFCIPKLIKSYKTEYSRYNSKKSLTLKKNMINLEDYSKKIDIIKSHLKCGNAYQINFTSKKFFTSSFDNSFDLYNYMRSQIKPKEGFFLHTKTFDILSFSPELFIKIKDGNIETLPIKGTRPRSDNSEQDLQLKTELFNSSKDRAEHLMIVDLLRNDLGKICQTSSIKVKDLYNIESFKTIHHMVTKIIGKLKNKITETDIIRALFPGGSITGAPKESAMKIIDQLEIHNRNIYTGSAGYICNNGDMYFNICIRTLLKLHQDYEYGIGGGIVWDSNTKDEWHEADQKSKILDLL